MTKYPEQEPTHYGTGITEDIRNGNFSRQLGKKAYELKDHLGNVRVTFSDIKMPTGIGTQPFRVDLLSKSEYFPYGMKINDLSYNAQNIAQPRYGYNGTHEQDKELNADGNYLDFGNFGYDTRVAMRRNQEPLNAKYPNLSGYSIFNNNPINMSDPTGYDFCVEQEGWEFKNVGYVNSLGNNHPFYFDNNSGEIKVNNFDRSQFTEKQLKIIDTEKALIEAEQQVIFKLLENDRTEFYYNLRSNSTTLSKLGKNGAEGLNDIFKDKDGNITRVDIYVAKAIYEYKTKSFPVEIWQLGFTSLHEGGHAYNFIKNPNLSMIDNLYESYKYDRMLREVFEVPHNNFELIWIFFGLKSNNQKYMKDIKIDNPHNDKEPIRYENENKK